MVEALSREGLIPVSGVQTSKDRLQHSGRYADDARGLVSTKGMIKKGIVGFALILSAAALSFERSELGRFRTRLYLAVKIARLFRVFIAKLKLNLLNKNGSYTEMCNKK